MSLALNTLGFSLESVAHEHVRGILALTGAVGGQPDVLRSVEVTAVRHVAADIQRQSAADADSLSLLRQQSTASASSPGTTVVTMEHANQPFYTADATLHPSLPQQPLDTPPTPIRYYFISSNFNDLALLQCVVCTRPLPSQCHCLEIDTSNPSTLETMTLTRQLLSWGEKHTSV